MSEQIDREGGQQPMDNDLRRSLLRTIANLHVDQVPSGRWMVFYPDGTAYVQRKYKTAAAAKREITRLRKEYEPAP